MNIAVTYRTAQALKDAGLEQPTPAVGQFWYSENAGLFILHGGFSDESKRQLFEKTRQILDENSVLAGIDIEAEWKKVCRYL